MAELAYDIAVLRLDEPLEFNDRTDWAYVASREPTSEDDFYAVGWGRTSTDDSDPGSRLLKAVSIHLVVGSCL